MTKRQTEGTWNHMNEIRRNETDQVLYHEDFNPHRGMIARYQKLHLKINIINTKENIQTLL